MSKAVRFERYGASDVLEVVEIERPEPGPGEVLVEVIASAINPGEAKIRSGALDAMFPTTFPSGEGSDLAGRVSAVGVGVQGLDVGDDVIGFSDERSAHATHTVVPAGNLVPKPAGVSWEEAATLFVAGTTASAAVKAVGAAAGDVVVVAGATGGVGLFAAQLAHRAGATVIGIARESDHDLLRSLHIVPVAYGEGVAERIRLAASIGGGPGAADGTAAIDAFIDTVGTGQVELALSLGVAPERIDTIADFDAVRTHGVKAEGNAAGGGADTIRELAAQIVQGSLVVPIDTVYPLERVAEAYDHLEQKHVVGKIVLRME